MAAEQTATYANGSRVHDLESDNGRSEGTGGRDVLGATRLGLRQRYEVSEAFSGDANDPIVSLRHSREAQRRFSDVFDLYSSAETISPHLAAAMKLLKEASENLSAAVRHSDTDDVLEADDLVQRVKMLMPELYFHATSLGDGFASGITSLQGAIANLNGLPASSAQIRALHEVARRLRNEPFLSINRSLELDDLLENVGLTIEASEIDSLLEILPIEGFDQE